MYFFLLLLSGCKLTGAAEREPMTPTSIRSLKGSIWGRIPSVHFAVPCPHYQGCATRSSQVYCLSHTVCRRKRMPEPRYRLRACCSASVAGNFSSLGLPAPTEDEHDCCYQSEKRRPPPPSSQETKCLPLLLSGQIWLNTAVACRGPWKGTVSVETGGYQSVSLPGSLAIT